MYTYTQQLQQLRLKNMFKHFSFNSYITCFNFAADTKADNIHVYRQLNQLIVNYIPFN